MPKADRTSIHPAVPDFSIVAETTDFLVVNKPAGLLMHPTKPDGPPTLWDALQQLLAYEKTTGNQLGLVNRLDRETSGLVLVAKNSAAAARGGKLLMERRMSKVYLALCKGWPERDAFIRRDPIVRLGEVQESSVWLRRGIHPSGQEAETNFTVLERRQRLSGGEPYSLVRAEPRTGRTHQIRVHLAGLGHPIVGDKLYDGDGSWYLKFIQKGFTLAMENALWRPHHALHASELSFVDGDRLFQFKAPLPADFFPAT